MRTDENNNPTAFTCNIAFEGGLRFGIDYDQGAPFEVTAAGKTATFYTAKILGDPIELTIQVIDKIGFRTKWGSSRWIYINGAHFIWLGYTKEQKIDTIGWMYQQEGGTEMRHLFPNYGKE